MSPDRETRALGAGRLCALLVVAWMCGRAVVDPDLWGHLRFGLDLLDTRHLSSIDPYSFTQDAPWINHEWLSELIFALAYRVAGVFGLVLLKTVLLGVVAALLFAVARRADHGPRWWLFAAAMAGLAPAVTTFRPQLWTVLGLAVVCRALVGGWAPKWLPLVFAVWANLHGGWIVGLGVFALWIVGRALDARSPRAVWTPVAVLVASALATVVTPYGWRLWLFLLSTVRMTREVSEWRPLWEQPDPSHVALWAISASLVAVALRRQWRSTTWTWALPALWLGASALFVDRLSPLFCEVALLVTSSAWRSRVPSSQTAGQPRRSPAALLVDLVAVVVVWTLNAVPNSRCLPIEGAWAPDIVAAGAFATPAAEGRLVLPFNWGQYAIWHWGPRLRVSMDGRRETVYSDATITEQAAIAAGRPEGLAYLTRVGPEYVWLPKTSAVETAEWLTRNGYRRDAETAQSFVATRTDLSVLAPMPPLPRCFP